jgi:predicted nucleic acid-binding Zn ribbon protein
VSREHDRPVEPGRRRRGRSPGKEEISREGANAGDRSADGPTGGGRDLAPRGMERLADLLPRAAREYGLEDQLDQARAALAWDRIVADRVPAAAGACRLTDLRQGVATIEIDLPIVAQEIRLRSPELLAALRAAVRTPIRQIRLTTRHV